VIGGQNREGRRRKEGIEEDGNLKRGKIGGGEEG
jgi:hypothetical protein